MLRSLLFILALAGCGLLVAGEFSTLYDVKVITVIKDTQGVGDNHGYALLIIAIAAAVMTFGATVGGSRPAGFALLALAVAGLAIALIIDLPNIDKTGLCEAYESCETRPQSGFYLETLGAVLLLLASVGILVFRPAAAAVGRSDSGSDATAA